MTNTTISYPKTGLLLLFLLSASVMLATIFYSYDKSLVVHFNQQRTPFWDIIFMTITNSAGIVSYGTIVILLLSSFFVKKPKIKFRFYAIILAGIFSGILVTVLKCTIQRIRPFHLLSAIHPLGPGGGWSYPSGHTSDAFFFAAILWLLYPRHKVITSMVYVWAVLVGLSRVYLGVHYPSDVLAAIALSSASSLAAFAVVQAFGKARLQSILKNGENNGNFI